MKNRFTFSLAILVLLIGSELPLNAMKRTREDEEASAAKKQRTEQTITIQCSDGKKMIVPKDLLRISPWLSEMIQDLANTPDAVIPLSQVDFSTMKTVITFMHLKFNNGELTAAMDEYINGMSIDGEHDALYMAAQFLDLAWLKAAMLQAGFVQQQEQRAINQSADRQAYAHAKSSKQHIQQPPLSLSMHGFPAENSQSQSNVPALKTLIAWELAKQCEKHGTLEHLDGFQNVPFEVVEYIHSLHCIAFGARGEQYTPFASLLDLQNFGLILTNVDFGLCKNLSNAEIISYLVQHNFFDELEEIFNVYLKHSWLSDSFNPYALLVEYIKTLSGDEIREKFNALATKSDQESTLKMALRLVLAKEHDQNLDLDVIAFLKCCWKGSYLVPPFPTIIKGRGLTVYNHNLDDNRIVKDQYLPYLLPLLEPLFLNDFIDIKINISGQQERTLLPATICHLKNLVTFEMYGANFTALPDSIGLLVQLRDLNLCHSKIQQLPESCAKLVNLLDLDLTNNPLSSVPLCIGKMKKLQRLILFGTNITALPEWLKDALPQGCIIYVHESVTIPESLRAYFDIRHNYNVKTL